MPTGAKARLFVAVDVPAAVRERLCGWARAAAAGLRSESADARRSLRLLDPDSLHLTLCFLGSRPVEEIAAIGRALEACPAHLDELSLGAPLWLPRARPRALAVAVHDEEGNLARLHAAMTEVISAATAWEPQRARFRAHITVARTRAVRDRARRSPAGGGEGSPLAPTPAIRFTAEFVTLYRSWLAPGGSTYEALRSCRLVPAGR